MLFIYILTFILLMRISSADFRTRKIPDILNLFLFMLGIGAVLIDWNNWLQHFCGLFFVPLIPFLLLIFIPKKTIGAGDIKLLMCLGFITGFDKGIWILFISCIFAFFVWGFKLIVKKQNDIFAFGPSIALASFVVIIFG